MARSRERILDAAEQLLAEQGDAAAGIAAISQASGLPASSRRLARGPLATRTPA